MKKDVYIFIGQSGAGKGTQIELLQKKVHAYMPEKEVLHVQTGDMFRSLIAVPSTTATRTKECIDKGVLPPAFLGIHAWAHIFIERYNENQTVCIDGTPRIPDEVPILLSAIDFYDWHPHVIYLSVGDQWAFDHMRGRGRADDRDEEEVRGRIAWFHESVIPSLELLTAHPHVTLHTINGEQSVEAVHADVSRAIGLI